MFNIFQLSIFILFQKLFNKKLLLLIINDIQFFIYMYFDQIDTIKKFLLFLVNNIHAYTLFMNQLKIFLQRHCMFQVVIK